MPTRRCVARQAARCPVKAQSENSRMCSAPMPSQQLENNVEEWPAHTDSSGVREACCVCTPRHLRLLCSWKAERRKTQADKSKAHLWLLLLLDYLLQATGGCNCPVYLSGLFGLCYIHLRCLRFALARAVSWLEPVPSARLPISPREQMTANINKAHVVIWKQTLSRCK